MHTDKYGPPSSPSPYIQREKDLFVWKNQILSFQINNYDATIKKRIERYFVEKSANFFDKKWSLGPNRERPDFIVTEGKQQFRLEVCEIFTGPQDKTDSYMKKKESNTQTAVNRLRKNYESIKDVSLIVKFNGDICGKNMIAALPTLKHLNFQQNRLSFTNV
jgi:hypothetical protein